MVQAIRAFYPCRCLIVLDLMEHRLELAKKYGADLVINPAKENALEKVLALTENVGCDVYIEATGHPSAVQQGLDLVRKGGTFVEFSVMSGPSTIDWSIIGDAKEITIRGSQLIDGFKNRQFFSEGIVSHQFPLQDFEKAYLTARSSESVKVILVP